MPIDLNDPDVTNFEGRRAEVRADYEARLVTAAEYQATAARIDQDEDEYFRRLEAGEQVSPAGEGAPEPSAAE